MRLIHDVLSGLPEGSSPRRRCCLVLHAPVPFWNVSALRIPRLGEVRNQPQIHPEREGSKTSGKKLVYQRRNSISRESGGLHRLSFSPLPLSSLPLPSDEVGDQHPGGAGLAVVSWVPGRVFALLPVVRMLRSATDARPVTAGARPKPGKVATALCRD